MGSVSDGPRRGVRAQRRLTTTSVRNHRTGEGLRCSLVFLLVFAAEVAARVCSFLSFCSVNAAFEHVNTMSELICHFPLISYLAVSASTTFRYPSKIKKTGVHNLETSEDLRGQPVFPCTPPWQVCGAPFCEFVLCSSVLIFVLVRLFIFVLLLSPFFFVVSVRVRLAVCVFTCVDLRNSSLFG